MQFLEIEMFSHNALLIIGGLCLIFVFFVWLKYVCSSSKIVFQELTELEENENTCNQLISDRQAIKQILANLVGMFASEVFLGQEIPIKGYNQDKILCIKFTKQELFEIDDKGNYKENNQPIWFINIASEWNLREKGFPVCSFENDAQELDEALDYFYGKKLVSIELVDNNVEFHFEDLVVLDICLSYHDESQLLPPLVLTTPDNEVFNIEL